MILKEEDTYRISKFVSLENAASIRPDNLLELKFLLEFYQKNFVIVKSKVVWTTTIYKGTESRIL